MVYWMSCFAGDRYSAVAPAKINLTLRVLGARADGYHDLESVVAKVTLYDGIDLFGSDGPPIQLECSNPTLPIDARNTVWQAIELMQARTESVHPLRAVLHKRIPEQSGLGGGSSDAAAVLCLLNQRWDLQLNRSQLAEMAAQIGSDVPAFCQSGAVWLSGRGESVQPVDLPWAGWWVLVFPPFGVSTAEVYAAWKPASQREAIDSRDCLSPEINTAEKLSKVLFNDLEDSAFAVEPRLKELKDLVEDHTDRKFHLTGSGSTLFACVDSHDEAQELDHQLSQLDTLKCQITRVITWDDNR